MVAIKKTKILNASKVRTKKVIQNSNTGTETNPWSYSHLWHCLFGDSSPDSPILSSLLGRFFPVQDAPSSLLPLLPPLPLSLLPPLSRPVLLSRPVDALHALPGEVLAGRVGVLVSSHWLLLQTIEYSNSVKHSCQITVRTSEKRKIEGYSLKFPWKIRQTDPLQLDS